LDTLQKEQNDIHQQSGLLILWFSISEESVCEDSFVLPFSICSLQILENDIVQVIHQNQTKQLW